MFDFFFSSRRRHTRLQGDWSSDVCSSDLRSRWRPRAVRGALREARAQTQRAAGVARRRQADPGRSEERRVGKECRTRWSQEHEYKNEMRVEELVVLINGRLSRHECDKSIG